MNARQKILNNQVSDLLGFQVRLMGTFPWLDAEYSTELSQNEATIIKYKYQVSTAKIRIKSSHESILARQVNEHINCNKKWHNFHNTIAT